MCSFSLFLSNFQIWNKYYNNSDYRVQTMWTSDEPTGRQPSWWLVKTGLDLKSHKTLICALEESQPLRAAWPHPSETRPHEATPSQATPPLDHAPPGPCLFWTTILLGHGPFQTLVQLPRNTAGESGQGSCLPLASAYLDSAPL